MTPPPQLDGLRDELIGLLDQEIELLGIRIGQFDALYEAILHRRNDEMESLLETMTRTQQQQATLDVTLQDMRRLFARWMGCPPGEVRLASIAQAVSDGRQVESRRERIIVLAEKLKKKHLHTAVLLGECSRLNRMLLDGLLPSGPQPITTYGRGGRKDWQSSSTLLDTES
jgi:flagellar biosynthesis/type III secretory pathway chaperone